MVHFKNCPGVVDVQVVLGFFIPGRSPTSANRSVSFHFREKKEGGDQTPQFISASSALPAEVGSCSERRSILIVPESTAFPSLSSFWSVRLLAQIIFALVAVQLGLHRIEFLLLIPADGFFHETAQQASRRTGALVWSRKAARSSSVRSKVEKIISARSPGSSTSLIFHDIIVQKLDQTGVMLEFIHDGAAKRGEAAELAVPCLIRLTHHQL